MLEMQESSCLYMLSLIEDIMDLSKMEFNKFVLLPEWVDIRELIEECF